MARAARACLKQAREATRPYHPLTIVTAKAHSHAKVIGGSNGRPGPGAA